MNIVVTGASGLLGSEICLYLASKNFNVHALTRNLSSLKHLDHPKIKPIRADYEDLQSLQKVISHANVIVHCAAKIGDWGVFKEYTVPNKMLLENLLKSSEDHNPQFIHISSLGVYPFTDHYGSDESSPIATEGIDGYTHSKILCELACKKHMETGRNISVLRPGFIYGKNDQTVLPKAVEALREKKAVIFGNGDAVHNLTHVANIAEAIEDCISHNGPATRAHFFNIRDIELISKKRFFELIAKEFQIPFEPKFIPKSIGRFTCEFMELSSRLRRSSTAPLLTRAKFKFLAHNLDFSIKKAENFLGYKGKNSFCEELSRFKKKAIEPFRGLR